MHCICLCAWGSGKPADHEAGAMVFRHAGGIAAVVSAPHCLLVYRPVRCAPPHHATLGLHLNNIERPMNRNIFRQVDKIFST